MKEQETVEFVTLFCPWCSKGHEDVGEFAHRKHHTHLCVDDAYGKGCMKEWRLEKYVFGASPDHELDGYFRKFCCPECGSSFFGVSSWEGPTKGYCHGEVSHPMGGGSCNFSWPSTDDHKYFHWHHRCKICDE